MDQTPLDRSDEAIGRIQWDLRRIILLVAASVLVFGALTATWRNVETGADLQVTIAATVTAVAAQVAAIVGSMFGRPTYRWMRAVLLSIFAVVSSMATAILIV